MQMQLTFKGGVAALTPKATSFDRFYKVIAVVLAVMILASLFVLTRPVAFCDEGAASTISQAIKNAIDAIYGVMTQIVLACAGVALACAGFVFLAGGRNAVETAKKMMILCFFGVAVVMLAPLMVKEIGGWFSSGGGTMSSVLDGTAA